MARSVDTESRSIAPLLDYPAVTHFLEVAAFASGRSGTRAEAIRCPLGDGSAREPKDPSMTNSKDTGHNSDASKDKASGMPPKQAAGGQQSGRPAQPLPGSAPGGQKSGQSGAVPPGQKKPAPQDENRK